MTARKAPPADKPKAKLGRPPKPRPPKPPAPSFEERARKGGKKAGTGRAIYTPAFAVIARTMCRMGALDKDLAEAFDVCLASIKNWRAEHPEFAEACAIGKAAADDMVEQALFHRAIGYEHPAEKIFNHNGTIVRAETIERYAPDTGAAAFWLKNRRPKTWRDRHELEVTDVTPTGELLRKARERRKRLEQGGSDAS